MGCSFEGTLYKGYFKLMWVVPVALPTCLITVPQNYIAGYSVHRKCGVTKQNLESDTIEIWSPEQLVVRMVTRPLFPYD